MCWIFDSWAGERMLASHLEERRSELVGPYRLESEWRPGAEPWCCSWSSPAGRANGEDELLPLLVLLPTQQLAHGSGLHVVKGLVALTTLTVM
jgi:hypothetical protein